MPLPEVLHVRRDWEGIFVLPTNRPVDSPQVPPMRALCYIVCAISAPHVMWTPDRAVLEANLSFYEAFAAQDLGAMSEVWALSHHVSCIHPGWQAIHGREQVISSWRAVLRHNSAPIRCEDARASVFDEAAFVTCVERIASAQLAATNLFVLEDGLWRMIHHHAAPFTQRSVPDELVPPRGTLN